MFIICSLCEETSEQDEAFMPSCRSDTIQEWVRFCFVRGSLTDYCASGTTMDKAIVALQRRLSGEELRILKGLALLKQRDGCRNAKIYDPWFRDFCSQRAVIELRLLLGAGDSAGAWFLLVAAVMRLNKNLIGAYSDLWKADDQKEAQAIIATCTDKNSITQLGNVSFEQHCRDLLNM